MAVTTAAILQNALDVVSRAPTLEAARRQLSETVSALTEGRLTEEGFGGAKARGRTFYDSLISEILENVRRAVSREELLTLVMEHLGTHGGDRIALGYLVLSTYVSQDGSHLVDLTLAQSQGYNASRIENYASSLS